MRATEAAVFEAVDHGDMPAWHVRRKLRPDLDAGFRREPGVYFMYRELGRSDLLLDGLDLEQIEPAVEVDTPGIQFWLAEREDRIEVEVLHYLSEYPLDVAEGAARSYLDVLAALVADPERPAGMIVDDALGQGEKGGIRV